MRAKALHTNEILKDQVGASIERIVDPRNPSVTQALQVLAHPGLEWMKANKPGELAEAAALGTLGHKIVEVYLKDRSRKAVEPLLVGAEARQAGRRERIERVLDWIDENVVDIVWSEGRLDSEKWGYHGHPDLGLYLKDDPIPWCLDLKFVETIDPLYALQVAGYVNLLEEKFTALKFQAGILQASKEGLKFRRIKKADQRTHWTLFAYALTMFKSIPQIKL